MSRQKKIFLQVKYYVCNRNTMEVETTSENTTLVLENPNCL